MSNTLVEIDNWKRNVRDKNLMEELNKMSDNELIDSFYKELSFGTGGLRGVIGVGCAKMNIYTVARATRGLALYLLGKFSSPKVAVSYDSRIKSDEFARLTATVLALYGIEVVITPKLMPTPFLSYLTREENCNAGVMITASHNPAIYNGYKVYQADGCQITEEAAEAISNEIKKQDYFTPVEKSFEFFLKEGKIKYCDNQLIDGFLIKILKLFNENTDNVSVTYSALNGTGISLIPEMFIRKNIKAFYVEEQMVADGNFPTCPYPNPEKPEALSLSMDKARESESDILIATDPDADRIGVAVRQNGDYQLLTGNEVGVVLAKYLLDKSLETNSMPKNPVIVKTIVTTDLINKLCKEYGVEVIDVLTGFKYIGEVVGKLEQQGRINDFILGLEESCGYLTHTFARDKDAVSSTLAIINATAYYKFKGLTLVDVINGLYEKYGYYKNRLHSYSYPGAEGLATMQNLMQIIRNNCPSEIGGFKVQQVIDYLENEKTGLPKSDVLSYSLEGGAKVIIRPSGTEPLLKTYLFVCSGKEQGEIDFKNIKDTLDSMLVK